MYERYLRPDELMHFGVLGMKWGIRRYQNPDGTLTKLGKERQRKEQEKLYNTLNEHTGSGYGYVVNNRDHAKVQRATNKIYSESKELQDAKKAMKNTFIGSKERDYDNNSGMYFDIGERYIDENKKKYSDEGASCLGAIFYCMANGNSPKKVHDDYWKHVGDYQDKCKKTADIVLGEFGDKQLKNFNDHVVKANSLLAGRLRSMTDAEPGGNLKLDLTEYYTFPGDYDYGSEKELQKWFDKNYSDLKKH